MRKSKSISSISFSAAVFMAVLAAGLSPAKADSIKIGLITTHTGPGAVIGRHMEDGAQLAMEELSRKMGELDAELIVVDDQQKPEIGRQVADQLIKRDRVDVIAGVIWSNVLLAIEPSVVRTKTLLISSNAGPSALAGKDCSPYFFAAGLQNEQAPEALGKYMNDKKIENVFIAAPNYQAGKDDVTGFKRFYKGNIVEEIYFPVGQQDFAAELSQIRDAKPGAIFLFAPGGMGVQFVKQFAQAGLKERAKIYSVYSQDEVTLPGMQDAALGNFEARNWVAEIDNPANVRFVENFKKKFGYSPSFYAANTYDAIMLIAAAAGKLGTQISDRDAFSAEIKKADFDSVRGKFSFNTNNFPVQSYYLAEVVKSDDTYSPKLVETISTDHKDAYSTECPMK